MSDLAERLEAWAKEYDGPLLSPRAKPRIDLLREAAAALREAQQEIDGLKQVRELLSQRHLASELEAAEQRIAELERERHRQWEQRMKAEDALTFSRHREKVLREALWLYVSDDCTKCYGLRLAGDARCLREAAECERCGGKGRVARVGAYGAEALADTGGAE